MILFLLTYLGGVLTIVSPCILPVLPFVFARADRPFLRNGLPMLVGLAVTFAAVATLAAVAGGWAVEANQYGRGVALALLALFGLTLLFRASPTTLLSLLWPWAHDFPGRWPHDFPGRSSRVPGRSVRQCCSRSCSAWRRGCCGRPAPAQCWALS